MFGSKLLWRLYAGYVAIFVITSLILGTLVSSQVSENSLKEIESSLAARTELLAEIARHYLTHPASDEIADLLQTTLKGLDQNTQSRLTIISSDGTVLADSPRVATRNGQSPGTTRDTGRPNPWHSNHYAL